MSEQSVLVVEDTDEIRELVTTVLRRAGFDVREAVSGAACLEEVRRDPPDLIVLDLGLPDGDGTEVCRQIRAETQCYVLMLTARADEVDLLVGLSVGADDYLVKPFEMAELLARIEARFRRMTMRPPAHVRCFGDVRVDSRSSTVERDKRKAAYQRVQQIVADDVVHIFLYWLNGTTVLNKRLQGYKPAPGYNEFWNADEWWVQ